MWQSRTPWCSLGCCSLPGFSNRRNLPVILAHMDLAKASATRLRNICRVHDLPIRLCCLEMRDRLLVNVCSNKAQEILSEQLLEAFLCALGLEQIQLVRAHVDSVRLCNKVLHFLLLLQYLHDHPFASKTSMSSYRVISSNGIDLTHKHGSSSKVRSHAVRTRTCASGLKHIFLPEG